MELLKKCINKVRANELFFKKWFFLQIKQVKVSENFGKKCRYRPSKGK
jgi:hypothetical protein